MEEDDRDSGSSGNREQDYGSGEEIIIDEEDLPPNLERQLQSWRFLLFLSGFREKRRRIFFLARRKIQKSPTHNHLSNSQSNTRLMGFYLPLTVILALSLYLSRIEDCSKNLRVLFLSLYLPLPLFFLFQLFLFRFLPLVFFGRRDSKSHKVSSFSFFLIFFFEQHWATVQLVIFVVLVITLTQFQVYYFVSQRTNAAAEWKGRLIGAYACNRLSLFATLWWCVYGASGLSNGKLYSCVRFFF